MRRLRWTLGGALGVLAVGLGSSAAATRQAAAGPQVVGCDLVMAGSGSAGWRHTSLAAGPLGVARHPLRQMSPYGRKTPGQLVTKMPLLVEGHRTVTLSVPPRLARRAFLYYGTHEGRDGRRSTSFYDSPGSSAIEFHPCADKPRTVWPGGIRIKGRSPIQLRVAVEGRPGTISLRLGRPKVYKRR